MAMALRAEQLAAHLSTNSIDDMLSTKIQPKNRKRPRTHSRNERMKINSTWNKRKQINNNPFKVVCEQVENAAKPNQEDDDDDERKPTSRNQSTNKHDSHKTNAMEGRGDGQTNSSGCVSHRWSLATRQRFRAKSRGKRVCCVSALRLQSHPLHLLHFALLCFYFIELTICTSDATTAAAAAVVASVSIFARLYKKNKSNRNVSIQFVECVVWPGKLHVFFSLGLWVNHRNPNVRALMFSCVYCMQSRDHQTRPHMGWKRTEWIRNQREKKATDQHMWDAVQSK